MTETNIIGYYKEWILAEKGGTYYVVRRKERILFKGTEGAATKSFGLLIAGGITEEHLDMLRLET